jgi:hypothetical protein
MNEAERLEFERFSKQLDDLQADALPIVEEISVHTRRARNAMGGRHLNDENEIVDDLVDTLTLSNEQVELGILLQRIGDRISEMGYIARGSEEFYKRVMEGHKVRLTQVGEAREVVETDPKTKEEKKVTKYVPLPAGVADSMKIGLAHEVFELHNSCQKQMDQLVYIRKSTDKTIDTIRSKLSYEKANDKNA